MSEPKSIPSEINSTDTYKIGNLNITGLLKVGVNYVIDGQLIANLAAPISFDSPIRCSSFSADLGSVSFFERAARQAWAPLRDSSLITWYDFSDTSTIAHTSGEVSTVTDKGPNGHDLTGTNGPHMSAAGDLPTTNVSRVNGLNVMNFTNKSYLDSSPLAVNNALAETMVVHNGSTDGNLLVVWVSRLNSTTTMQASSLVSMNKTSGSDWQLDSRHGGGSTPTIFQGAINGTGTVMTANGEHPDWSIWSTVFDFTELRGGGKKKYLYVNGSLVNSATTNKLTSPQRLRINSSRDEMSWPKTSHGEWIIGFDIRLQEIAEGYLAHKWGLEGSLPSDHPYKASSPKV
jgi:hypothetical protein